MSLHFMGMKKNGPKVIKDAQLLEIRQKTGMFCPNANPLMVET